jgi:hypothetical protein
MNPNKAEKESKSVAEHLAYLEVKAKINISHEAKEASVEYYGDKDLVHELTAELCAACKRVDEDVIYNGRDPNARKLADWWDNHKEGEERRRLEDEEAKEKEEIRQFALTKLSKKEREALGIDEDSQEGSQKSKRGKAKSTRN